MVLEPNIVDFQPYSTPGSGTRRSFLATVHKNRELKIFRLRKKGLEYQYITKFTLDTVPHSFLVYRDIFVITYTTHLEYVRVDNKGKEIESLTRINPLLWHQPETTTSTSSADDNNSMAISVFDESIQAFIITKDDSSFYMDLKGVYDHQFNKIKWSNRVLKVFVVRPYLIGFLPNCIEIKCIFNPNRVVQKVELLQSQILRMTVAYNNFRYTTTSDTYLDSLYVLLSRKNTNIKVLMKCTQIDPRFQVNMLIERKLYSTGLKICEFLMEQQGGGNSSSQSAVGGLSKEQYIRLQKEKGFYNFVVKRRYTIAKDIFREYKVPLSHVIMLFAELYPDSFIKKMVNMFDVKVKEIPYHELLVLGGRGNEAQYVKKPVDSDKRAAMREFLTFFLQKRDEIIEKIKDLSQCTE